MDQFGPKILSKILTSEELDKISEDTQTKINKYFEGVIDEYLTTKAVGETSKNVVDEVRSTYEKKVEDLTSKLQDYEVKLESSEKNVNELRIQLDAFTAERTHLVELTNKYEMDLSATRSEKNSIIDERDSLLKTIERQNIEIERLQGEVKSYQEQLKSAINSKCQALTRLDEIESKEAALDFKEKRMEQERVIMANQIQALTTDLNRNISELQNIRRENIVRTMNLETKLNEKVEELKIAQTQCGQYKSTIDVLTNNAQELSAKVLAQSEKANKLMEFYEKELQARTKLAELYKTSADEQAMESTEMSTAITDLKRMVTEASDQYGELETKMKSVTMKHEEELEEKNKLIESLRAEIAHANDLLKELKNENLENAIGKLAPSAAVASRLIKSDMSLTELYSLYVKTTEECEHQKRENSRLNLQMKSILHELEERAPIMKKQELEYEKLVETNNILAQQLDEMILKKNENRNEFEEAQVKINHLVRENKKLKQNRSDLSRQVCYLLKEIEQIRCGYTGENNESQGNSLSTDEVISKKLVTFSSISELQENNQKLLLLVRDLSDKLEEMESIKQRMNEDSYQEKIENYAKKIRTMQDSMQNQTKMLNTYMAKCERYKRLYFEACTKSTGSLPKIKTDDMSDDNLEVDKQSPVPTPNIAAELSEKEKQIADLEKQLAEARDHLKSFKEQYEYYTKEKKNNEKIMNEQFDSMRTEVRELTSTNCKLMSTVEYNKEQLKIQKKNIVTYKQQITTLEERNKNYENTIIKHEQATLFLKDEILKAQKNLSAAEAELNHTRQETRLLKDAISRMQSEKEGYHRERQNQNLLLNNLEMIKASFERSEMEGKARLETRLDETTRELCAQRRRYQEEQDRFRELTTDLKRQTDKANERMKEEKRIADSLRTEMLSLREELNTKSRQIEDLSKKLQESLTPTKCDNPISMANKKIRELELKNEEAKLEINSLTDDLAKSKEHAEQYFKISQSAESELKNMHDMHKNYVAKVEAEMKAMKQAETLLKSQIEQLETELQLAAVSEAQTAGTNTPAQLQKTQQELKEALQKLNDCNRDLRNIRSECNTLSETLNTVEQKYANEMVLHSADIQELSKVKSELANIREQISTLQEQRDKAENQLAENKKSRNDTENILRTEKEELESRLKDLDAQNVSLHNQIQMLTSKLTILSSSKNNESLNDSQSDANKSLAEDEIKSSDQLLQIIKYLRREKDISVAKVDILKSENVRLVSEQQILQKKVDELNGFLEQERTKSETVIVTASRHEEILRKIETLNAITDSNRILREERDSLSARVKELNDRIGKVEEELFPQQKQNRELNTKIEELVNENNALRTEAIKWRQRANLLIEKSNKNPEEFKRLQTERESLAKMLTSEKEILRQAHEELNQIKAEKSKMEIEIANLSRQLQTVTEDKKKLTDDLNTVKQNNTRLTQELLEVKNQLHQKEDSLQKATEELESKDAMLIDLKNKEVQIRKIAKRYKDSYTELSKSIPKGSEGTISSENLVAVFGSQVIGESSTATKPDSEKELKDNIEELNSVIKNLQDEIDKIRKENEELRASLEKDDRGKLLLREAKSRIMNLTESKNSISQELAQTKTKLQSIKQSTEEHEAMLANLKDQYDEKISRLEKELLEQVTANKEALARFTRENESLIIRINQLNRQLGLQQSAKPSTSSSAITDKSCISESSPRTANVKPMSGSSSQQSATVNPWRGSDTPLASIRPISVQNSRTAAILPTSQNSSISVGQGSSSGSNTALVPPQQQVHTTGSNVESMSSSPTSSHTDYMPSTSSAAVAVAAIPPMGTSSAAECSQEAESLPTQNSESQVIVSGGQQQVVALVSPRVEGSQNAPATVQSQQEPNNQPSTSGTTSSSHVSISSHRHASSSSNVTTTQAVGHKRPRDVEGDSSTGTGDDPSDKSKPPNKRTRSHAGEVMAGVSESGIDVEYQVPTSSQRDQEDDIVIVDSEEEEGMADEGHAEADDGPAEDGENEGYEDSYEQDQDLDENECPEVEESNIQADNNEVDIDECMEAQVQCTSDNQVDPDAGTSVNQDNNQQSQAISSGSCEPGNVAQTSSWKQTANLSRQQKATLIKLQQGVEGEQADDANTPQFSGHRSDSCSESVSSPHGSKFMYSESTNMEEEDAKMDLTEESGNDEFHPDNYEEKKADEDVAESEDVKKTTSSSTVNPPEVQEQEIPQASAAREGSQSLDSESIGASQSGADIQQNQVEGNAAEEADAMDAVSSEGEKANVEEDLEISQSEEGREAEASTSQTITTRSKATRGSTTPGTRRPNRGGFQRGRPTPIIWQDQSGSSRSGGPPGMRGQDGGSPSRGFQNQRGLRPRRMRRAGGSNYGNMRYN